MMSLPEGNTVTAGTTYSALSGQYLDVQVWPDSSSSIDVKYPSGNVVTLVGSKGEFISFLAPFDLSALQIRGAAAASGQIYKYSGILTPTPAQLSNNN